MWHNITRPERVASPRGIFTRFIPVISAHEATLLTFGPDHVAPLSVDINVPMADPLPDVHPSTFLLRFGLVPRVMEGPVCFATRVHRSLSPCERALMDDASTATHRRLYTVLHG